MDCLGLDLFRVIVESASEPNVLERMLGHRNVGKAREMMIPLRFENGHCEIRRHGKKHETCMKGLDDMPPNLISVKRENCLPA